MSNIQVSLRLVFKWFSRAHGGRGSTPPPPTFSTNHTDISLGQSMSAVCQLFHICQKKAGKIAKNIYPAFVRILRVLHLWWYDDLSSWLHKSTWQLDKLTGLSIGTCHRKWNLSHTKFFSRKKSYASPGIRLGLRNPKKKERKTLAPTLAHRRRYLPYFSVIF